MPFRARSGCAIGDIIHYKLDSGRRYISQKFGGFWFREFGGGWFWTTALKQLLPHALWFSHEIFSFNVLLLGVNVEIISRFESSCDAGKNDVWASPTFSFTSTWSFVLGSNVTASYLPKYSSVMIVGRAQTKPGFLCLNYCFLVVKMWTLYPMAVNFRFFIPNGG